MPSSESMADRARKLAETAVRRLFIRTQRCFRACFFDETGKVPTYEGGRVLADLRHFARFDRHSFIRDGDGRLDPLSMARIEGRREVVHRILLHLHLDETKIRELVEVNNE